jgi:hypothetical protein
MMVIAILVVLVGMLLPRSPHTSKAPVIVCMSNLHRVGSAALIYASDHQDQFPWSAGPSSPGGFEGSIVDCFQPLRPFLDNNNKLLVCPTDSKRFPATEALQSSNLSYFINLSSQLGRTNQVLAGDRNLSTNGVAVGPGRIAVRPELATDWTRELHSGGGSRCRGVVSFVDGSASPFGGSSTVQAAFEKAGVANQTILIP